ncbi:hypothetical protein G6O67_007600 [Ophiocordyceps sinensis]|uniref:Sun n=2 Tax=Ophiocordyceps sinensis TaxID=72228 RepID=A0A8H4LUI0_9HYPO|nr:sun [Ophiocordyceps sinensis CO18]KAF4505678.1 hypothetical protein G6O67_007600 [Ophiocordyceps sinensis]
MKGPTKYTLVAVLAASAEARSHHHHHHRDIKRNAVSAVQHPSATTEATPEGKTIYMYGETMMSEYDVKKCLKDKTCAIVTESVGETQTSQRQQQPTTTTKTETPDAVLKPTQPAGQQELQQTEAPSNSNKSVNMTAEFPNDSISCSEMPVQYGAIRLPWLHDSSSWSSLLRVKGYPKAKELTVEGTCETCEPGCMCSYACPVGYGETQWPKAQGSNKESVGGLECNPQGRLSLTNPSYRTLCRRSAADIKITNRLGKRVSSCRTAYPGTEAMVIPAVAEPGMTIPLWIPVNTDYTSPTGGKTSAEYYINHAGVAPEVGCVWKSETLSDRAGDLAPVIMGGSVDFDTKNIFLSIHQNIKYKSEAPKFNITIEGDVIGKPCWYKGNEYPGPKPPGVVLGCTATVKAGGSATFVFS